MQNRIIKAHRAVDFTIYALGFVALIIVWLTA
jgi:allophanate hydrolase subunit 1